MPPNFLVPAIGGKGLAAVRFDRARSSVVYENKGRIARRVARLSRAARARVQALVERRFARDLFVFASRRRKRVRTDNHGRTARRAPLGPAAAAFRAGARLPSPANVAGDGVF